MRKIFLIAFLLTSVAAFSQTAQFGDWYFRQRIGVNKPTNNLHPNSVFEVNDSSTGSLFRIYKNGGIQTFKFKNNSAEDSILTTDQFGNFKLRLKPSTVLPWDSITGKPSLLISGNNLADVSNVATARTNLSVYSIATVNDSLLNHYTKSQADARFKSIDWFPSVANVTGLPDSLTNLQARVQTKEPFISAGTSAQYWRGDKSWQTLDKSAVGLSAVPNVDATNPANISQSATYRFVTDSEKSTWDAKQNALGYTAENAANKATDFSTVNNTLYPTVQAVSNAISTATSSYIPLSQKGANNGVATLDVGGKVPFSQLPAALMIYKGTWNVSTNTPTLADGTGVTGWVYIVSVGGTVNTGSGNITYSAGDYAIHNGSTWEKSAGTNNVASVNGQQGVVNLTTANISESGNLYYTDARARAALSFTPGSGGYNSSTGVITIPTNTNQLTNGAGFITGYTETDPTIYAWAKAATKPSYSYSEITSTPTTWAWASITGIPSTFTPSAHSHGNADITDVAWAKITGAPAFITSNQTITLSGDISGSGTTAITTTIGALKVTNAMIAGSIDYSKMNAATVPTWNQNTTGNAATATLSNNSTLWNSQSYSGSQAGTINLMMVYEGSTWKYSTASAVQSFLGLGSNAYTSTAFLPLSGGTLTGGLIGTAIDAAAFNSNGGQFFSYTLKGRALDNYGAFGFYSNDGATRYGYIQSHSTNGGQLVLNGDGGGQIVLDNRGIVLGQALIGTSLSMSGEGAFGGGLVLNNGVYYKAKRNTNGSVINMLGFESGTDDLIQVFSNNWKLRNTGTGDAANVIVASVDKTVTFSGAMSGTSSSMSGSATAANLVISGRGTGYILGMPDWRIYNTSGNGLVINNYTVDALAFSSSGVATFVTNVNAYGYFANATTGGWDRAFAFKGSSGTARGGLGAFGSDDALDYYYIGQDYTNYKIRVNNSSGNIGINALGANAKLEVVAPTGEVFRADASGGAYRIIANQTGVSIGGSLYSAGSSLFNRPIEINTASGNYTLSAGGSGGDYGSIGYNVDFTTTSGAYNYRTTDYASFINFNQGGFRFFSAPSSSGVMSPTVVASVSATGAGVFNGSITATSLIRSGGTSSQFLKADGSVDANTYATTASLSSYATTASLSGYVNTSTNQLEISGNKSFLGAVEVLSIKTTGGPGTPGVLKFGTKTNDTVFTGGSAYSIPVNIDGTTYYIRLWAGIN